MAITCDGPCMIFDGETKISTGKQQKQGGESAINSKLGGETHFPGGSSSYLGGAEFQRGSYWGVFMKLTSGHPLLIPLLADYF